MPRSMGDPGYVYTPHSKERRARASVLAKRRLGAPEGHSTVYSIHVPDAHAATIRVAAQKIAAKQGAAAATDFVRTQKLGGFHAGIKRDWSPQEDAALRRQHYAGKNASQIAQALGRTRNSIIGRRYRLNLRCPPKGCVPMPIEEVRKLVAGHLDADLKSWDVTFGAIVVAPMFISETVHNIAAFVGVSTDTVRTVWERMKKGGVWNEKGMIDKERYMRGTQESDFLLVLDVLLAKGDLKRSIGPDGEELWAAAHRVNKTSFR